MPASSRTFRIWRGDVGDGGLVDYRVEVHEGEVVLDVIHRLQATQTPDLACRWNCKAGKCGSCSVEINGTPKLACMTRMSTFTGDQPVTVTPLRTFPVIRDLVTDVSYNYVKARENPSFAPPPGLAPGEYRMRQIDVARSQEFRKCIECFLCQTVCHVVRDHEENKPAFAGPRLFIHAAELDMHPLDTRTDRSEHASHTQGIGYCNITKCCTEVCPEHIRITDNAIIPMKERVADQRFDPVVWLGRKILRRDQMEQAAGTEAGTAASAGPEGRATGTPATPESGAPRATGASAAPESAAERAAVAETSGRVGVNWGQVIPAPQPAPVDEDGKLPLTETRLDRPGAASPFGDDVTFPLPTENLSYFHPSPDDE